MTDPDKLSVVPEVFYDLISRIPAGAIVLLGGYFLISFERPILSSTFEQSNAAAVLLPIVGLIVSYVIGLGLSALTRPVFRMFARCKRSELREEFAAVETMPNVEGSTSIGKEDFDDPERLHMKLHAYLKTQDARVGLEMAKHQAEASLFANLSIGLFLLALVVLVQDYLIAPGSTASLSSHWRPSLLLAISALICVPIAYLRHRSSWRHHCQFAHICLKKELHRQSYAESASHDVPVQDAAR